MYLSLSLYIYMYVYIYIYIHTHTRFRSLQDGDVVKIGRISVPEYLTNWQDRRQPSQVDIHIYIYI